MRVGAHLPEGLLEIMGGRVGEFLELPVASLDLPGVPLHRRLQGILPRDVLQGEHDQIPVFPLELHLPGVHHEDPGTRALELVPDLQVADFGLGRQHLGEELPEPRVVPLPIPDLEELPAQNALFREAEGGVEGRVRRPDPEGVIEDEEGRANRLHCGVPEVVPGEA